MDKTLTVRSMSLKSCQPLETYFLVERIWHWMIYLFREEWKLKHKKAVCQNRSAWCLCKSFFFFYTEGWDFFLFFFVVVSQDLLKIKISMEGKFYLLVSWVDHDRLLGSRPCQEILRRLQTAYLVYRFATLLYRCSEAWGKGLGRKVKGLGRMTGVNDNLL